MHEFDRVVNATPADEGRWEASVPDGWDFSGFPNGGLLMATLSAMLGPLTGHPDPVTVTAHYTAPAVPGPAVVEGEMLRSGKRLGTAGGRLVQGGKVVAHALGTFGDLQVRDDGVVYEAGLPDLPPPDECIGRETTSQFPFPPIFDKVDMRFHPDHLGFATGDKHGKAEVGGWMRFADGRPADPLAMLLFADAHPPAIFNAPGMPIAWTPTIELTVHVHKRPAPGWIAGWFTVNHVNGGFLEEDGVLWDERGDLVAVSRQMAMVPRS